MPAASSLLIGLAAAASLVAAPTANPAGGDSKALMASLTGRWACAGAFANGRPLLATLEFTPDLAGEGLHFHHFDLPPASFVADASWSVDKESGELASLAWTGMQGSSGRSAALYVADQLSPTSVRLVQRTLLKPPFAPNRFTYSVAGGKLSVDWEVEKAGRWVLGDYLRCAPAAKANIEPRSSR